MNFSRNRPVQNQVRVNHRIRALEVRVITQNGAQAGVLSIGQALKLASEQGLDLVEVSPEASPPVCRIVDFGKFRYEQAKKHKGEHSHASKLKELKFRVNIGESDYAIKLRHAAEFLQRGMRVKISLFFRGREMAHQEYGMRLITRIIQDTSAYSHTDANPRLIGKNLHAILVPGKAKAKAPPQSPVLMPQPSAPAAPAAAEARKPFGASIKIDLKPVPSTSGSS